MQSTDELLKTLSLEDKVAMLSGELEFYDGMYKLLKRDYYHTSPFPAARNRENGIPGLAFIDGPRGIVLQGGATCFPVSMARGATWNPELERSVGDAIGKELRALGGNLFGGVCVNLLRHPAWGRAQETYGEDPVHLGVMGAALTRGVETHGMACVKHFAANSIENARFKVDVTVSKRALHEIYLPHFKDCIDAGATSVMSAYNSLNGEWCGQNKELLTGVLRDRWEFEGFVFTDFVFGMRDAKLAIEAGLDLEMPFNMVWGDNLLTLAKKGDVSEQHLDRALARLIKPQFEQTPAESYGEELLGHENHKKLAREAAVQSMVLLKNEDNALPLLRHENVVVIGSLASTPNLGDHGSSDCRPEYVVTPLEGLSSKAGACIEYTEGLSDEQSRKAAEDADAVVVVVGYTYLEEGEHITPPNMEDFAALIPPPPKFKRLFSNPIMRPLWPLLSKRAIRSARKKSAGQHAGEGVLDGGGDRSSLDLKSEDEELILQACQLNSRVIVALMGGSAITMENWRESASSILMTWYPGMEGGHAFADILYGDRAPSGKLPFVIPKSFTDLPFFDKDASQIEYDLWHGYRKLGRDGKSPAFPFGFGLSYNRYSYSNFQSSASIVSESDTLALTLNVRNHGQSMGDEIVQLYVSMIHSSVERAPLELKAFQRVRIDADSTALVTISLPVSKLAYFDEGADDFMVEPGKYQLHAAGYAGDPYAISIEIEVQS